MLIQQRNFWVMLYALVKAKNLTNIYGDGKVTTVGNKIGGKVKQNIDLGIKEPTLGFTNACALRISYSLNYSGVIVNRGIWKTVSGSDKKWYIYRVRDLVKFLTQSFGALTKQLKIQNHKDFKGEKVS